MLLPALGSSQRSTLFQESFLGIHPPHGVLGMDFWVLRLPASPPGGEFLGMGARLEHPSAPRPSSSYPGCYPVAISVLPRCLQGSFWLNLKGGSWVWIHPSLEEPQESMDELCPRSHAGITGMAAVGMAWNHPAPAGSHAPHGMWALSWLDSWILKFPVSTWKSSGAWESPVGSNGNPDGFGIFSSSPGTPGCLPILAPAGKTNLPGKFGGERGGIFWDSFLLEPLWEQDRLGHARELGQEQAAFPGKSFSSGRVLLDLCLFLLR